MSFVYAVYHRPPEMHSDEESVHIGIYTTRTLAIEVARAIDGEWKIVEYGLNRIDPGTAIWDEGADAGQSWADFYRRYWPVGTPRELIPR